MADFGGKNDAFALHLASGMRVAKAAEKAGISQRTASRLRADPAFQKRVQAIRGELVDSALGEMSATLSRAARTLRKLLKSASEGIQLQAAKALLDLTLKARDAVELQTQLQAIESQLQAIDAQSNKHNAEGGSGGKP